LQVVEAARSAFAPSVLVTRRASRTVCKTRATRVATHRLQRTQLERWLKLPIPSLTCTVTPVRLQRLGTHMHSLCTRTVALLLFPARSLTRCRTAATHPT